MKVKLLHTPNREELLVYEINIKMTRSQARGAQVDLKDIGIGVQRKHSANYILSVKWPLVLTCANEDARSLKGMDCEIPYRWRDTGLCASENARPF